MEIKIEKKGEITLVSIADRLDASTTAQLDTRLAEIIDAGNRATVISLKDLIYISSAGLRTLLSFAKKLHVQQRDLYFADLGEYVNDIFKISGFYSIFTIFDTTREALLKAGTDIG